MTVERLDTGVGFEGKDENASSRNKADEKLSRQ